MPGTLLVSVTEQGVVRELWRFGPPSGVAGPERWEVHVYLPDSPLRPGGRVSVVRFTEPDGAYRMLEGGGTVPPLSQLPDLQ